MIYDPPIQGHFEHHMVFLSPTLSTIPWFGFAGTLLGVMGDANVTPRAEPSALLTVEADLPAHQMAGGIGASWHAIRVMPRPAEAGRYRYNVRPESPLGSAVGGNPPLDSAAWKDLDRFGRWLGLDWIRVELSRRMFEPQQGLYEWDNEEMRTLYRILDWCQQNDADVFLTEMCRDVDWLAYPEAIHS